jgi:hypothetical protein
MKFGGGGSYDTFFLLSGDSDVNDDPMRSGCDDVLGYAGLADAESSAGVEPPTDGG